MKRVITYGTFDLLHYGHINLLRRARALGDYLVVGLSTDEFTLKEKRKRCYFAYEQRKALLEAVRYVDLVIPEETWEQKRRDARELGIGVFAIGDDWQGKFDFLKDEGVEVVYLPRTPEVSTTQIKEDLRQFTPPPATISGFSLIFQHYSIFLRLIRLKWRLGLAAEEMRARSRLKARRQG